MGARGGQSTARAWRHGPLAMQAGCAQRASGPQRPASAHQPSDPMLRRLYDWTLALAATALRALCAGAVSFAESSFFPVPPDVMLVPMCWPAGPGLVLRPDLHGRIGGRRAPRLCHRGAALRFPRRLAVPALRPHGRRPRLPGILCPLRPLDHPAQGPDADPLQARDHHVGLCGLQPVLVRRPVDHDPGRPVLHSGLCCSSRYGPFIRGVLDRHFNASRPRRSSRSSAASWRSATFSEAPDELSAQPPAAPALVIPRGGRATIGGALGLRARFGLPPCKLCLMQRNPYYLAMPLALAIALVPRRLDGSRSCSRPDLPRERRTRRLPCRRRMGRLARAQRLRRRRGRSDRQRGRFPQPAAEHPRDQLHAGGMALPRPITGRLECGDLAGACRAGVLVCDHSRATATGTPAASA